MLVGSKLYLIGTEAFLYCIGLTAIFLFYELQSINFRAFYKCKGFNQHNI